MINDQPYTMQNVGVGFKYTPNLNRATLDIQDGKSKQAFIFTEDELTALIKEAKAARRELRENTEIPDDPTNKRLRKTVKVAIEPAEIIRPVIEGQEQIGISTGQAVVLAEKLLKAVKKAKAEG